ncbi:MAG TPA: hypothetical protein VMR86_15260 [Myxococcota bacterium]|nr:hypothetical protein [Myxococcota bacterium]
MKRISLVSAVVFAATLPFPARAGGLPFVSPISSGCPTVEVAGNMADPNIFASHAHTMNEKQCDSLCKHAVAECKQVIGTAVACYFKSSGKAEAIEDGACIDQGGGASAVKACKATVHSDFASSRQPFRNLATEQAGLCVQWGSDCATQCATLSNQ